MDLVKIQRAELAGIPCLITEPAYGRCRGNVIFYHGWSSRKEQRAFLAKILSQFCYRVVVPDAVYHGERGTIDYGDPQVFADYSWRTVLRNIEESSSLLRAACNKLRVAETDFAVAGESMGGFSAAGAFLQNSGFRCLVNINGSCAFEKTLSLQHPLFGDLSQDQRESLAKYDPAANPARLNARPILMLHGTDDTTVPVEGQRYFSSEISPNYQKYPHRLRLVEYPHLDHYFTLSMAEETVAWLHRFFLHS